MTYSKEFDPTLSPSDSHYLPPLKLIAKDHEDLFIVSSHLQDAFLPLHGMILDMKNRTFSMLCHRFCWEHQEHTFDNTPIYHRVSTGLTFHTIQSVHHNGLHEDLFHPHDDYDALKDPTLLHHYYPLNLLTLHSESFHHHTLVRLLFSGGKVLKLMVDDIHCTLGDLSPPWPTYHKPSHVFDNEEIL